VYTQTDGNVLLGPYFPLKKSDPRCSPSQEITSDECNAICPLKSKQRSHLIKQDTQVQNTTENQTLYYTSNILYWNMDMDVNRQISITCKPME